MSRFDLEKSYDTIRSSADPRYTNLTRAELEEVVKDLDARITAIENRQDPQAYMRESVKR